MRKRDPHPPRSFLLAALLALGCAAAPAASKREVTEAEARRLAEQTAEASGYARGVYEIRSSERVKEGSFAGIWAVFFEHVPPAPPGGHCTVYVRIDDGTARLFPGK
jgi:hypothetical protein